MSQNTHLRPGGLPEFGASDPWYETAASEPVVTFVSQLQATAMLARRDAEREVEFQRWCRCWVHCPRCGWLHDTEGETQPIYCHGCHIPFSEGESLEVSLRNGP